MASSATVFICYRTDDTAGYAGWLRQSLASELGEQRVLMDANLQAGDNFAVELHEMIHDADVLLVLIGREWLDAVNSEGEVRLSLENDVVRLEIAEALGRHIPVVPILLGGARMP